MAWTATLTDAKLKGLEIELYLTITDGVDTIETMILCSTVDPRTTPKTIVDDIAHIAKSLGKWPWFESKIGTVIAQGE